MTGPRPTSAPRQEAHAAAGGGKRSTKAVALTPLLGRETELAEVRALLDGGETRVATLTGPGGIGKTRLALEVATVLRDEFAHGVCFVALASVRDAVLVPATVAQALGIQPSAEVTEAVATYLRDRHLLLVLDNLEHLADGAAGWVAELLSSCPGLHVLATSRVPLRIGGDRQYPVEPLDLPGGDKPRLDDVRDSAASRLFMTRAQAVRPDLALTEATAEDVAGICRAVDGLPLAIELAAARVAVLSLPVLRARLANRLALLTEGRRDAPPRHQTMRSAIAWSYDLLGEDEQALFRRLAVFTGGFTLEAAEDIGEDASTIAGLTALVKHSLVRRGPEAGDGNRFSMLETIREFGLERLSEAGEETDGRGAHARYFIDLVADLQGQMDVAAPGDRRAALTTFLDRVEAERDNLRGVIAWLTRQDRIEEAMRLAVAIRPFHGSRGHDVEARSTLEALLSRTNADVKPAVRAGALLVVGNFARSQGELRISEAALQEALALARAQEDRRGAGRVLHSLGWTVMDLGRYEEAFDYYRESIRLARTVGDREGTANALDLLGLLSILTNDHDAARQHLQEAREVCRITGDRARLGNVLGHLGLLTLREGDVTGAERLLDESAAIGREVGDRHLMPMDLRHLADIAMRRGHRDRARSLLVESLAITRETGYISGHAGALTGLAALALEDGDTRLALRHLKESVLGYQRIGLMSGLQYGGQGVYDVLACVALEIGDSHLAARFLGMADGLLDRIHIPRPRGVPFFNLEQGRFDTIRRFLDRPEIRAQWEAGFALGEDAMVAEVLAFEVPDTPTVTEQRRPEALPPAGALSTRETEVLGMKTRGLTNQQIADELFISRRTVTSHTSNILGKLGLETRTSAVAWAIRHGIA